MTYNDSPVHIGVDSLTCEIEISQAHLDGLSSLIQFLQGFHRSGGCQVPGHFELMMHYRELRNCALKAKRSALPPAQ